MRKSIAGLAIALLMATASADAGTRGIVRTTDVDLATDTIGRRGTSTPIIAVNGGPGLSHAYMVQNGVWNTIAASGRQVVFYDQRGTGKSTRVRAGAPQTMDAQVADLEAVRAKFGFTKFDLVGDSYGGFLGMAYALKHPERIHKLVLSDSPSPAIKDIVHLLPQVYPDIEAQDAATGKRLGNTDAAAQASLRNHFRMIFYSETNRDAYLAHAKDLGYNPKVGEAVSNAASKLDMTAQLPGFTFPTLVLTGRFDMNVAPLTAWKMSKAIPGAKLVIFEKSGHLPSYEEPGKYVRVLERFLDAK
ncbi:MAG: alpha/beta fold hydrolase [Candidatus Velthaea sp.]